MLSTASVTVLSAAIAGPAADSTNAIASAERLHFILDPRWLVHLTPRAAPGRGSRTRRPRAPARLPPTTPPSRFGLAAAARRFRRRTPLSGGDKRGSSRRRGTRPSRRKRSADAARAPSDWQSTRH